MFLSILNVLKIIIFFPLLNLLVFFYHYIPDIGLVIILLTVLSRLLLLPSFHKSLKQQKVMQELQPKIDEVKQKYKDDKQGEMQAMMELYKKHDFNPLSSCLPLVIQLPILIALYQVFIRSLNGSALVGLYSFVPHIDKISPLFLHFFDLSKPNAYLAIAAAILQHIQTRMILPKGKVQDPTAKMSAYMTLYYLPLITLILGVKIAIPIGGSVKHLGVGLPAGLVLYWVITTLFSIGQQYYIIWKEAKQSM
jgi:YidC/Oxa1 family membrane protein insertase